MVKRIVVLDGIPANITRAQRGSFPQSVGSQPAGDVYLLNADSSTVEWPVDEGASVPDRPTSSQWSIAPGTQPGEVVFSVLSLNGDGGSAITGHEYQIADGAWQLLSGAGATGPRTLTMADDGVEYSFRYRRRNAVGPSLPSDPKTVKSFFNAVKLDGSVPSLAMTVGDDPITLNFDDFIDYAEGYFFGLTPAPAGVTYSARGLTATADAVRAGVSIPITAYGAADSVYQFQIVYAVSEAVDPGSNPMILKADQSIVAAQTGVTWEVIEPYELAGDYVVPTTTEVAKAPTISGQFREGGEFVLQRALWWYDDADGVPTFSWQILADGSPIAGAPTSDPNTDSWVGTVSSAARGAASFIVRETMTVGGTPYTSDTTPVSVSELPAYANIDTFPNTSNSDLGAGYTRESGIPYTPLNFDGPDQLTFTGTGYVYASGGSSNANSFRRGETGAVDVSCGAIIWYDPTKTRTGDYHGLYPAVRMPRAKHAARNLLTGITCVYDAATDQFVFLRYVNGLTHTVLGSFANADFGFVYDDTDPDIKTLVDISLVDNRATNEIDAYVNGIYGSTVTDTVLTANSDYGLMARAKNEQIKIFKFYGDVL